MNCGSAETLGEFRYPERNTMSSTSQLERMLAVVLIGMCAAAVCAADTPAPVEPSQAIAKSYAYARLRPIGFEHVKINAGFLRRIRNRSRDVGLPDYLNKFEANDYVNFFRWVKAYPAKRQNYGPNNNEFVYKHLEAMGVYAAESDRIARLHKDLSATIRAAQADDGYLNTFYQNPLNMAAGHKRFQTENRFEFYNFGHYTQAAIAHYRATGDRHLLDSAVRFADLIVENFADPGDLPYRKWKAVVNQKYEHPNHELAMVELYRQTGNHRYLDFARQTYEEYEFFGPKFEEIWGHAVQETLLYTGATDLYLETGDQDVRTTVDRLWRDMCDRKRFVTGGVGSQRAGESYGAAYYLPHENCYQETCAGIALFFWNHKMLLATGNTVHADEMERSLYNNILCGISLDGTHYFYSQPLRYDPVHHRDANGKTGGHVACTRHPFLSCSCCPPNLHRLFAAIGDYIYTHTDNGLQVNLYANSTVEHTVDGQTWKLSQQTDYPHGGSVRLTVVGASNSPAVVSLRIPAWAENAVVKLNGKMQSIPEPGQYFDLHHTWNAGDAVDIDLGLTARIIQPNSNVEAQTGRLAMMVGPLVYCVERADNPGIALRHICVAKDVAAKMSFEKDLLGGVNVLTFPAMQWTDEQAPKAVEVRAIPYYAWANREPGFMNVWLFTEEKLAIDPPRPEPSPRPVPPVETTKPTKSEH
jgi:DUF1680 family protein